MTAPKLPDSGIRIAAAVLTPQAQRAATYARDHDEVSVITGPDGETVALIVSPSLIERFTAHYEHAEADCAALSRAWQAAGAWTEVAERNAGLGRILGLDPATLKACADHLRKRVSDEPAEVGGGDPGDRH